MRHASRCNGSFQIVVVPISNQIRCCFFAVVRAIEVLGEAANRASADARSACPEIPWSAITDMRNRLIHGYFDIDVDIVWNTASTAGFYRVD
ncbi:MAG: DUF86 domain-containing protein [Spirochaetes bacterium]|nr:DUF86 domain-containing protein [Spirochaetota bacterium]